MKKFLIIFVILTFLLVGCQQSTPEAETTSPEDQDPVETAAPEEAVNDETSDSETETESEEEPEETEVVGTPIPTPLPIDPLNIKFLTSDGVELDGEFWAPTYPEAPVVVLMHQYPMDHNIEWVAIAPWLQNRGLAQFVRSGGEPWADPSWFQSMAEGVDFGVFTFTFRNCLGGCKEDSVESREEWILDAVAAIENAASFTTIDKEKVLVVGTSIGADAAVDACARLLDSEKATCIGVVSLSPGSYLDEPFEEAVVAVTEAGIPVRCVAAEEDTLSAETCQNVEAEDYEFILSNGSNHGIRLFDPSLNIDMSELLQAWLIEWAYVDAD